MKLLDIIDGKVDDDPVPFEPIQIIEDDSNIQKETFEEFPLPI